MVSEFSIKNMLPLNLWSKQALPTSASETGSGSAGASLLAQMQFGHHLATAPGFLPVSFSSALFRPGEHSPYNYPALHPSFFRPHLDPATLGSLLNPRGMAALHHNSHSTDAMRDVHPSAFTPAKRMRLHEEGSAHSPRDGRSPHSPRDETRDHDRPPSGSSTRTSPGMTPVHRLSYSPASSHRTNGDIIDHHVMNGAEDLRLKWKVEDGDGIRCPICRALLQAGEIRPHLYKEFNSLKEQLQRGTSTQTETCTATCDINDNSSKSRYDTFLRIRRNREARLGKLRGDRKRKRYSDEMSSTEEHLDVSLTCEHMPPSPCRELPEEETVDVTSCEEPEVSVVYHSSPVDNRQSPENRPSTPEQKCVPQQSPFHDQRTT